MNRWLLIAGGLSAAASLLHVAVIFGGPDWYRFFGAGERMARAAAMGHWLPTAATLAIASVLAVWAAYGFSGAGLIPRLPLLRTALALISAIYLVRAVAFVPTLMLQGEPVGAFALWSSLVVLVFGLAYAVGTWRGWASLATQGPRATL